MRATHVKEKVDHAAVALFAARGVNGVSIAEIAAAAGVAQGALYRHYRSKEELAARLFADAYCRTGAELAEIGATHKPFDVRIAAMVAHFCELYDRDPALFRFMLLAQHELLPAIDAGGDNGGGAPVAAIEAALADAITAREIAAVDAAEGAAVIMGIVLQTALFHLYGRLAGPLVPRAPALARAAIAAVQGLGDRR